ncbi:hypothetical protein Q7P37_000833 [Cladosporium fusiforme]
MLSLLPAVLGFASAATAALVPISQYQERSFETVIKPKICIISLFTPEAEIWHGIPEFDLLAMNITVPGLSAQFPDIHCTEDGEICQVITSMGEINAAVTISSLLHSSRFDLTSTYFMTGGIGGVNPEVTTIGSVTFARYAVQVALQHEFDIRDLPGNFSTGYIPIGSKSPSEYPEIHLRHRSLRDQPEPAAAAAVSYRANYISDLYAPARGTPSVLECDVATSDVYYSGKLLGEAFANYTTLATNGSGIYCTSAQEDNAVLEALLRGASSELVDFSRIMVMRTGSNFDRPFLGGAATTNLLWANQGGFEPAVANIYRAGIKVIEGILDGWNATFAKGVNASNYIGDIYGTIGGKPDFGPYVNGGGPQGESADIYARNARARLFVAMVEATGGDLMAGATMRDMLSLVNEETFLMDLND